MYNYVSQVATKYKIGQITNSKKLCTNSHQSTIYYSPRSGSSGEPSANPDLNQQNRVFGTLKCKYKRSPPKLCTVPGLSSRELQLATNPLYNVTWRTDLVQDLPEIPPPCTQPCIFKIFQITWRAGDGTRLDDVVFCKMYGSITPLKMKMSLGSVVGSSSTLLTFFPYRSFRLSNKFAPLLD